jgi:hypothetical protein
VRSTFRDRTTNIYVDSITSPTRPQVTARLTDVGRRNVGVKNCASNNPNEYCSSKKTRLFAVNGLRKT